MVILEQDGSEDPWASRMHAPGELGWMQPVSHLLAQRFTQQCTQPCQTTDCKQLVYLGFNLKGTTCVCTVPGPSGLKAR